MTVDSLLETLSGKVTIVKIDFPFSVPEILRGSCGLMQTNRPKLVIRAGFDENVLLDTYTTIKEINPAYRVFLRYTVGIPHGLTIFAI